MWARRDLRACPKNILKDGREFSIVRHDQEDFSQWRGCPTDLWANLGSLESGEGGEEEGAFESPIGSWLMWI